MKYECTVAYFPILIVQCPVLDDPANGEVVVNRMPPGDTATYACDSGFELVGADTLTCGDDGQWSPAPPICRGDFS